MRAWRPGSRRSGGTTSPAESFERSWLALRGSEWVPRRRALDGASTTRQWTLSMELRNEPAASSDKVRSAFPECLGRIPVRAGEPLPSRRSGPRNFGTALFCHGPHDPTSGGPGTFSGASERLWGVRRDRTDGRVRVRGGAEGPCRSERVNYGTVHLAKCSTKIEDAVRWSAGPLGFDFTVSGRPGPLK